MANYIKRDNSGTLFPNARKNKDNHPDYQGFVLVDGGKYRISAWIKQGKKGKFYSIGFTPYTHGDTNKEGENNV